jgi:hypothetical protein
MKKKMLFMAAIAGLISLGSCVKDDVSGSVEAVRNAKAQELLGEANEHNANAALANANAALVNATQSAEVALRQAQAALAQANAQIAQANAKLKDEALAEEIAKTVAGYEADLATEKARLETQVNAWKAQLRAAATSNYDDIAALMTNYQLAYNAYTLAEQNVVNRAAALEVAKINAEYAADVNAATILGWEQDIERYTAELAALKEVDQKGISTPKEALAAGDAMQGDIDVARAEFAENPAILEFIAAAQAWYAAYKAYQDYTGATGAFSALNNSANGVGPNPLNIGMNYYNLTGTEAVAKAIVAGVGFADYLTYTDPFIFGGNVNVVAPLPNLNVNTYRMSEEAKYLADKKIASYPNATKTALNNAKNNKKDLEGELGKEGDKKDTKYKKTDGTEVVTLYAGLTAATENKTKAEDAVKTATANASGKPAAVETAYKALLTIVQKAAYADKQKDWTNAVLTLANAIIDAYGAPLYDPNLKSYDYTNATHRNNVVELLFGVAGKVEADLDDETDVKNLFDNTKATCIVAQWATGTYTKDATNITKVEEVKSRKAGEKSVITKLNDAKAALGTSADAPGAATAWGAYKAAKNAVDAQPQLIAAAQDAINVAQDNVDAAVETVEEWKAMIAACDTEAYKEITDDLAEASEDYNEALAALYEAREDLSAMEIEQAALYAAATQNVDALIAAAEANLATAQKNLEQWQANNSQEVIVAAAQKAFDDALTALAIAEANLNAAIADLEAAGLDLDGDDEPEEPTDEPEEPADEPAEGEGEGE